MNDKENVKKNGQELSPQTLQLIKQHSRYIYKDKKEELKIRSSETQHSPKSKDNKKENAKLVLTEKNPL